MIDFDNYVFSGVLVDLVSFWCNFKLFDGDCWGCDVIVFGYYCKEDFDEVFCCGNIMLVV